jgi:hypothetical protein
MCPICLTGLVFNPVHGFSLCLLSLFVPHPSLSHVSFSVSLPPTATSPISLYFLYVPTLSTQNLSLPFVPRMQHTCLFYLFYLSHISYLSYLSYMSYLSSLSCLSYKSQYQLIFVSRMQHACLQEISHSIHQKLTHNCLWNQTG